MEEQKGVFFSLRMGVLSLRVFLIVGSSRKKEVEVSKLLGK